MRTADDMALMHEKWCPADDLTGTKHWDPMPQPKPPPIPSEWLLHLWNHPHETWSFKASIKVKNTFSSVTRFLTESLRKSATACRDAMKNAWAQVTEFCQWKRRPLLPTEEIELQQDPANLPSAESVVMQVSAENAARDAPLLGRNDQGRQDLVYKNTPKEAFRDAPSRSQQSPVWLGSVP